MNITINENSTSWDAYPPTPSKSRYVQSLRAGNICIEHESQLYTDESCRPDYAARVVLSGRPAGKTHTASHAMICFYPDEHERVGSAEYHASTGRIVMALPLSEFELYVELLSRYHEINCTYIETGCGRSHAVVYGDSLLPEQLH